MYLGLGLLHKGTRLKFLKSNDVVEIPTRIGNHNIVKDYADIDDFLDDMFPRINDTNIPETVIMTTKNEGMYDINDRCLKRYRPDEDSVVITATNSAFHPEMKIPQHKMDDYNPGGLPPHNLCLKKGCILMLLRNWNLTKGLANGTKLRLLEVSYFNDPYVNSMRLVITGRLSKSKF